MVVVVIVVVAAERASAPWSRKKDCKVRVFKQGGSRRTAHHHSGLVHNRGRLIISPTSKKRILNN